MKLILRAVTSPYDDITKGSVLSHQELDNNQINLKGELIYTGLTNGGILSLKKINGSTIEIPFSGGGSGAEVTGFTFNNGNYNLTIFNSDNTSFTQNLGILSSDMTITGGTYNPANGVGTFTNNSGGTFNVTGFLTGYTDTYIVSGISNNYTGTVTLRKSDNTDIIITGLTSGTSINWYSENTNPPSVAPVATGLSSVAFGNNAEALNGNMFVYGDFAGQNATGSTHSNFIGKWAGQDANNSSNSNFIGQSAGRDAIDTIGSNFLGANVGRNATGSSYSNFFGINSGNGATDANDSNFIGQYAGESAIGASGSTFIGQFAGRDASGATNSNFFGTNVGNGSIGSNNIIIGTNISLPNNTSDAMNLGGILFGTGAYSIISDTPSITGQTNGKIGVGIVTPLEKLHISGNTRVEGGLILKTLTGGTALNNIGVDVDGNVVSGITAYNIFRYFDDNQIVTGTTRRIYRGDAISVTGATAFFSSTHNNGTSFGASVGHIGSIGNTNVSSYLQLFSNTANGTTGPNIIIGSYSGSSSTQAQLNFSATKDATYNGFGTGATNTLLFSFRDSYLLPVAKFNIGTDFIDFLSYPTTRIDTGTTSNYLATDSTGRLTSKPISGLTSGSTTTFTGGTVTGPTNFINGLISNTISATTYYNLPTDVYVTGGTYSNGTTEFTNNTGGTFNVGGYFTSLDDIHTTAFTFNQGTYDLTVFNSDNTFFTQNIGILSSDMTITGGTYNPANGIGTFVNNSGGTFDVSGFLTGQTDTYIVSGTSNSNTGTLTLRRSDNVNITVTGLTSGTSMNWYAENTAAPATKPVATGAGSIAFGNLAEALGSNMFVYGESAGNGALGGASSSNFMGYYAGNGATNASQSNFLGINAGQNSTAASNSNFMGKWAGRDATNASQSNFLGTDAGQGATYAANSNFIGQGAGYFATGASNSNFFGYHTGYLASNVSYSNLFGYGVGNNVGTPIGSNNIIIGTNISLPGSTSNAINLGGVLFGTGTYSTISAIPSITGQTNGRIGIGIVTPLEKLHVSGNTRVEGGLILKTLTGNTAVDNLGIDVNGNVVNGSIISGNTNFTNNLSANTLTSTNIKITLPTITGSTGEIVYFGTGSGLSAGLIYYFNSSGQWTVANATTSTSSKYLIGIALGSSITDGILIKGYAKYSVGNYSSVGTGDILYLGTTNGFFQTTAPSSSSEVVRVIGYCIDSANDIIYFNPDNTWVEIL
jgi:hypothetical protein